MLSSCSPKANTSETNSEDDTVSFSHEPDIKEYRNEVSREEFTEQYTASRNVFINDYFVEVTVSTPKSKYRYSQSIESQFIGYGRKTYLDTESNNKGYVHTGEEYLSKVDMNNERMTKDTEQGYAFTGDQEICDLVNKNTLINNPGDARFYLERDEDYINYVSVDSRYYIRPEYTEWTFTDNSLEISVYTSLFSDFSDPDASYTYKYYVDNGVFTYTRKRENSLDVYQFEFGDMFLMKKKSEWHRTPNSGFLEYSNTLVMDSVISYFDAYLKKSDITIEKLDFSDYEYIDIYADLPQ